MSWLSKIWRRNRTALTGALISEFCSTLHGLALKALAQGGVKPLALREQLAATLVSEARRYLRRKL